MTHQAQGFYGDPLIKLGKGAYIPTFSGWPYCEFDDFCFRAKGHSGRHATIDADGNVFRVWGPDVYYQMRRGGRIEVP